MKSLVMARLYQDEHIQLILSQEPSFGHLLDLAAAFPEEENRWVGYEALKHKANTMVGWDARQLALRSSACWNAMVHAFDLLLPDEETTMQQDISPEIAREWEQLIAQWKDRPSRGTWTSFETLVRQVLEEEEA